MNKEVIIPGKYVGLTYSILDDNGNVVEQHDLPVGFVFGGATELVGGMDKVVGGKSVGDEVKVTIPPEEGYGLRDESLTFTDDINNVPPEFRRLGAEVQMANEAGEAKAFVVSEIKDGQLTVDGNHPLAGKELTVVVRIIEVRDSQPGEDETSGINSVQMQGHPTLN